MQYGLLIIQTQSRIHKLSGNGHLGNMYTGIHEVEMGLILGNRLPTYLHRHNKNTQNKWKWAFGQYLYRDTRSGNGRLGNRLPAYLYTQTQ